MICNIKKEKGFTLLELMLAVAFFVVSTASVAYLFIGAQTATDYSVSKTQALLLARERIEEQREIRYEDGFYNLTEGEDLETITLNGRSYQTKIDVDYILEEVCKIESTVTWTSRNREESVSFVEHFTAWDDVQEPEEPEEPEE